MRTPFQPQTLLDTVIQYPRDVQSHQDIAFLSVAGLSKPLEHLEHQPRLRHLSNQSLTTLKKSLQEVQMLDS